MARGTGSWACALALGGLVATGCGGGGQNVPATCLEAQPCGGDLVGTWSLLGACADVAAQTQEEQIDCAGATVNSDTATLSGSITFNADSTYASTNWREAFAASETLPLSCTNNPTSCAANSGSASENANGITAALTTTCTGTSTCVCRISGNLSVASDSGSYAITQTVVAMTGGPTATTFSYCVDGDRLHLMQTVSIVSVTPTSSTETTLILSDIVAQRR
jgi:hypothetical protein